MAFLQSLVRSFGGSPSVSADVLHLSKVVVYLMIPPRQVFSWQMNEQFEIQAINSFIWVTQTRSSYDYWVAPGESIQISDQSPVWISGDGNVSSEISITTDYPLYRGVRQRIQRMYRWRVQIMEHGVTCQRAPRLFESTGREQRNGEAG
ncbi:DUF2917 domain-containing protein [Burkholderia multivorans]|uniref:DUF2917 domain-containing protein n=1 Tax=Burkholderia multivorans TaxID=87883 RepID=UPI0018C6BA86|nr:DUF2917 domain-containing protein [Burkholderia multivorans]